MQWLEAFWTREGPGIPKDAPRRTGLALFCEILGREWWDIVKLNLLFLAAALPLVTLPAAVIAMACVCRSIVEDRNVYLLRDFTETFRRHFWLASAWGAASVTLLGIGVYAAGSYAALLGSGLYYTAPFAVSIFVTVMAGVWSAYAAAAIAMGETTVVGAAKVAAIATIIRPLPVLAALAFVAALWVAHILFYPVSVLLPVTVNFSLGMFAVMFGAHRALANLIVRPGRTSQESEPFQPAAGRLDN